MNKILVIVAHADDEAIGCGGTLLKHRDAGDNIQIMFMTNGVGARAESNRKDEKIRQAATKKSCKQIGVTALHQYNFPDNAMDQVTLIEVVKSIEDVINSYRPNIIYTHHGGDLNVDHRIVHQAVLTACRPQPSSSIRKILTFEVNSSTEWASENIGGNFIPNYFNNISGVINEKKELLSHYQHEMHPFPHSRSIEAITTLNKLRGSQVGISSAEAFIIIRQINE